MRQRTLQLTAGVDLRIPIHGDYVRCDQAAASFTVDPGKGGRPTTLRRGKSWEAAQRFHALTFNSATAQTITIEIGDGRLNDNELTGSIDVNSGVIETIPYKKTASAAFTPFDAQCDWTPPVAAEVFFFNNQSGSSMYLDKLLAQVDIAAAKPAGFDELRCEIAIVSAISAGTQFTGFMDSLKIGEDPSLGFFWYRTTPVGMTFTVEKYLVRALYENNANLGYPDQLNYDLLSDDRPAVLPDGHSLAIKIESLDNTNTHTAALLDCAFKMRLAGYIQN